MTTGDRVGCQHGGIIRCTSRAMRTLGLRVKSGCVVGVVIRTAASGWEVERRLELALTEGSDHYARFPLHPLIELEGPRAERVSRAAVATVKAVSRRVLAAAFKELGPLAA